MRHGSEDIGAARPGGIIGLELAAVLTGAGLSVYVLNRLHSGRVDGKGERDRGGAARRYFDEHGWWPGEQATDASARSERRR